MRPLRLELSGFSSYRDETVLDFEDADYFALVGATGSGKSTIIDAICFALYGSVPRYDKGRVAPVISQGKLESRVRLDFSVGADTYTAVRVVRADGKGGATTREARLQKGEEPLAGNADEVTAQVIELLGLSFEHFTRCVVLPQGQFHRFLHATPADRQDLLIKLLNLGVYDTMAKKAGARSMLAQNSGKMIKDRLDNEYADATPEAKRVAETRLKSLKGLRKKVKDAQPKLEELEKVLLKAQEEATRLDDSIGRLKEVEIPAEMAAFADEVEAAGKHLAEAQELRAAAQKRTEVAEQVRSSLPEAAPLIAGQNDWLRHEQVRLSLAREKEEMDASTQRFTEAQSVLDLANASFEGAVKARDDLQHRHLGFDLAKTLVAGEPCPVCLQTVMTLPKHRKPAEISAADTSVEKARTDRDSQMLIVGKADKEVTALNATVGKLTKDLDELDKRLADVPGAKEIESFLKDIADRDKEVVDARDQERLARDQESKAREDHASLQSREAKSRQAFESVRERLIDLEPPPTDRTRLAEDWRKLKDWADLRLPVAAKALDEATSKARDASTRRDDLIEILRASCKECEVDPGDSVGDAVLAATLTAERELEAITKAIQTVDKLSKERDSLGIEEKVAHALAEHLSGKKGRFETWIVNEALGQLVIGASLILQELSSGCYGLTIDEGGNFFVIDHDNADETRSARTLSGGETFLASLALALALADQLRELATEGAARLDAIFLDEGFGTLDPDTLEIVAAAVENLAAGGRMVGIVTHVKELADKVPLQFRVTKDAGSSKVERIAS